MLKSDDVLSKRRNLFFALMVIGTILHAIPYIYNRSLWVDEATLASSILTRGLVELISYPLDFGQSAPIGYLYVVKILTMLLGNQEYVLRIYSLFSFVCSVCLIYVILKSLLGVKNPEMFTLIFVCLPFYMRYSNEFKPYMSDNMFVLISLLLWGIWHKKQISLHFLVSSYSIIIWFSFASVFSIATGMIIIVIELLKEMLLSKDKLHSLMKICECMIVALSFGLYYKFWLSLTSSNAGGQEFWNLTKFIFLPSSFQDLKTLFRMILELLWPLGTGGYVFTLLMTILALIGSTRLLKRDKGNNKYVIFIFLNIILMLIASNIGFYPISARLTQFVSIEILILATLGFDCLSESMEIIHKKTLLLMLLMFFLVLIPFLKMLNSMRPSKVYMSGTEVAANIHYLKKNITPKDMIYVSAGGIAVFLYENNYSYWPPLHGGTIIQPSISGNCIFGQRNRVAYYKEPYSYEGYFNMNAIDEDVALIIKKPSVYLFSSHNDKGIPIIVEKLKQYGNVKSVVSLYDNPLYHFIRGQ